MQEQGPPAHCSRHTPCAVRERYANSHANAEGATAHGVCLLQSYGTRRVPATELRHTACACYRATAHGEGVIFFKKYC